MSLFAELKRRNVFRVALLYMVAGWLILQLADVLFEQLGVPGWVFRFVFAILLICLPLVLVFSWVFEITPQGIKREQEVEAPASIVAHTGRKISRATAVLLILAVVVVVAGWLIPEPTPDLALQLPKQSVGQAFVDLQGHRGARGLLPENTIPAFLYALDLGVTTLEMDVVINAEGNVFLSHEPWMSAKICSHPDGREVKKSEARSLKIYAMTDADIRGFDCGSRGHPDFPGQQAMKVSKPMLNEVFEAVRLRSAETGREPVLFNIEIKSTPQGDGVFHPQVDQYARALVEVLRQHGTLKRTSIQSFDPRALEAAHNIDPDISLVLLVENRKSLQNNLDRLSFTPTVYSPNYERVNKKMIAAAHAQNIQVIPWTVNDEKTMRKLVKMGVDGLITDYPDLGVRMLAEIRQAQ